MPPGSNDLLIVDDSRRTQIFFDAYLKREPERVVHHAETVAEAEAMLAAGLRPAVALLDLEMPERGGEALYPALRALGPGATLTVIFTGSADESRVERALADAPKPALVLRKPVDLDELLAAIRGENPAS